MSHRPVHPIIAQLRAARETAGLSQEAVARRLRCHASTVGSWETGRNSPALDGLAAYAAVLGYQLTLTQEEAPTP
ncbi:hypothetical protein BJF83_17440 [Nocardiopsis sp. CNR-923]|uniref:helix-turn-helix domain-containing protein n=1 Tax=Nocardiopsis sp. CNR-923 TaxID=1904965 RepID=UPI00095C356F|nr:helix-turn-helix transcriptional regulator [Nocardiopsis sp. CNR-923]OLT27767.1 hypothetical protein BJF83_17440 [Nocardiopsis sp. CNR-923]